MRKKMLCSSIFACLCLLQLAKAQLVDESVLKNYQPAIISKIAAIMKYLALPGEKQRYLAEYFRKNDSIVTDWLLKGRSTAEIDSLQGLDNVVLSSLLTPNEMMSYDRKRASKFSTLASEGELQYIQEEYKPDSTQFAVIRKQVKDKYGLIYMKYISDEDNPGKMKADTKNVLKVYDLYSYFPTLYANKYVTDYISFLHNSRQTPDSLLLKIKRSFLNMIRTNKYMDWGKSLADISCYYFPDTAIYSTISPGVFAKEAVSLSATDRYRLVHEQHISLGAYDSVYHLIWEKNYKLSLLQYTYGTYSPVRCDSLINEVTLQYDSCIYASLFRDGSLQPWTQFAFALKYKSYLKLDPSIVDTLVAEAVYVKGLKDSAELRAPLTYMSTEAYESKRLMELLSEDQYTGLLSIKNRPSAYANALADWNSMEELHLTQDLNKENTITEITNFYIARFSAWERYEYDKVNQTAIARSLDDNKPKVLKALDAARWNQSPNTAARATKVQW